MTARLGIDVMNDKNAQLNYKHNIDDIKQMIDYVLASEDVGNLEAVDKRVGAIGEYNAGYNKIFNEAYYMANGKYRFAINTREIKK